MNKVDYVHGKFTLATTSISGFDYDEFIDWWSDMNPHDEIPSRESSEYYNWCREESESNWESDMDNIKYWDGGKIPVVITGGFISHPQYVEFYGSRQRSICPIYCDSLYEAVRKILDNNEFYDVEITYDDGEIYVNGYNHDGRIRFCINALSAKGIKRISSANNRGKNIELDSKDAKRFKYMYA